jgi:hypothetical protein
MSATTSPLPSHLGRRQQRTRGAGLSSENGLDESRPEADVRKAIPKSSKSKKMWIFLGQK